MALALEITRTLPLFPNGVYLQWALRDAGAAGTCKISVQRSGALAGPWTTLATDLVDTYSLIDTFPNGTTGPNQLSLSRTIYYQVTATPTVGAPVTTVRGVEAALDGRQRLLKRKILRDEAVMLRKLNGVEVCVLKRRHWGDRCPNCFDAITRDSIRANCSTCYGTTFVGGYFAPVVTLAKRSTAPNQAGLTAEGKAEIATTSVTILDAPALEQDDLLVFLRDNRRFWVRRVQPTELRTVTVHQRLDVSELARSDIAYRLKVDPSSIPRLF